MANRSNCKSTSARARMARERGADLQNYSSTPARTSILAAALLVLLQATQAAAQPICKPVLTVGDARFSEVVNLRRFWTAVVNVDASRCASQSGLFAVGFVRLAENGPDLEFAEPFFWHPGSTHVRVEFWADEAVQKYWVDEVSACPCRTN